MIRLDMLGALSLRGADGQELRSVLAQPKRLALLGYLAVEAANGFQRRDGLFALFWPELTQSQARQALRQSLYFLRRALGEHVLESRGAEEVGISRDALYCDVGAFTELLEQNRLEEALTLYRGDFLAGFFVDDASAELERWVDSTRDRVRRQAVDAAWRLADAEERERRASEAAHWARFATRLAPDDERSAQRLIALLDRQGNRAAALRTYAELAKRLQTEFDIEPSAETRAVIDAMRARPCDSAATTASATARAIGSDALPAPAKQASVEAVAAATAHPAPRSARTRRVSYIAMAAAAAALVIGAIAAHARGHRSPPVVAVGWIQDPSGADTGSSVRTLASLLATDLARVHGLHVVSHARLYDMLGQLGVQEETPSAISEAARRAGAGEILESVLSETPRHTLQLVLRRVDLSTGAPRWSQTFEAGTVFELADRATARVAIDFGLRPPAQPLGDVTTTSLAAERLYDEGLRRFYQSDLQSATELFHAALAEDTSFAMAAYYAGLGEGTTDGPAARRDLELALRLANRVSERERLIIRQTWAYATNDPAQLALAESLATRYPDEPGAEFALGRALQWSGDFLGAIPHLRRAIHLDSLSLSGHGPWCRACDALNYMLGSYVSADSLMAAERTASAWTRMQPRAAGAWWALGDVLGREERYDSALAAEQTAERFGLSGFDYVIPRVLIAIRSGNFAEADRMLADRVQHGNPGKRGEALWWMVISLRDQGRLRDALAAARSMVRTSAGQEPGFSTPQPLDAVAVAQVLFEMGRYHESATLFDSIANYRWERSPDFPQVAPGLLARHRVWMTTHVATALAAAGDTARLSALADTLELWGRQSALYRDRALHHYVSGLLLSARGRWADAERELRRALNDPTDGYSRVNLELGKALIAEGRPGEAIPVLRAPLHGPIEASNYYLTYTELHAALGAAFDRAGAADSAVAHYRRALSAWRDADPEFAPRIAQLRARVAALQRAQVAPRMRHS